MRQTAILPCRLRVCEEGKRIFSPMYRMRDPSADVGVVTRKVPECYVARYATTFPSHASWLLPPELGEHECSLNSRQPALPGRLEVFRRCRPWRGLVI